MAKPGEDLSGMGAAEAKEYIFHHITTLKLTEKRQDELAREREKWLSRVNLARSRGTEDLALAAQREADDIQAKLSGVEAEIADLKAQIRRMRDQVAGLAARERSVDPDLLEQELLMAAGYLPGDDEKAETERRFREMEKTSAADAALEELKGKMVNRKQADQ
jgi:phage shock protein A